MPAYKIYLDSGSLKVLNRYSFKTEGGDPISPQELVYNNPNLILNIPELELHIYENLIVSREYNTSRGAIDILMITSNADIAIIETKLLRNPESHRTVVAQAIDYAKAFYNQSVKELIEGLTKSKYTDQSILSKLRQNDSWLADLEKNLSSGNFQLIILGDKIHPNVLGMVESIQSAPHMAFTIYLVELDPFIEEDHALIITPKVVSKTVEVERSVIKIQIDHEKRKHTIDSEVPEEKGKGTKPIITPEQYLNSVSKPEFGKPIERFWDDWRKIGGDIRFGTSGLSAGITQGEKRIPILFIYHNCISTISQTHKNSYDIPDDFYQEYKNDLRESQVIYDGYVVGNRVNVPFDAITEDDLLLLFKASMNIVKKLVGEI